ncbi:MAG: PAS domain S-box protein [Nitrospinae bacterium]|nr:PAS domain S-box protein [Nitrospinota bacterium]
MKIRHRLAYLIIIMSVCVAGICFFTFRQFYMIAIEEQRAWLVSSAQIQARLIESMVRFNAKSSLNYSEGAEAEALRQVMKAHSNFKGFGKTGEFTIARKEGDRIVFLLRHRHYNDGIPDSAPVDSKFAEPMQLALDGKSGATISKDYRGVLVIAAYEPVSALKLGVVAKIDVAEIRGTYIKSGIEAGVTAILVILAGALLFVLVTRPVIVELRQNENTLRLTLDATSDGSWDWDVPSGKIDFSDAWARSFGYERWEAGHDLSFWEGIIHPDDLHKFRDAIPFKECRIHRAVRKGAVVHVEDEVFWRKDGTSFPVEYWSYPMERDGKIIGAAVTFIDITERARMQAQLVHSEKLSAVGTFVAGVAHELNNPITAIHGFSRQLIKREYPMEEVRKKLGIIAREAERTGNLVRNLLRFSRKHQSGRSNVDVNELVENSLELQTYQFQAENIEVARDFSERPLTAHADPNQLQQVFLNIITNAQHAMAEAHGRGTLRVETRPAGNEVSIIFENSGRPMPDKILPRIFDPFFTTKEAGKGSGLGLSICNEIMKDHGGRISAENIGQDGVRFIVSVPALSNKP